MFFLRNKLLKIDRLFNCRQDLFLNFFCLLFSWSCNVTDLQNMNGSAGRSSANDPGPANNRICFSLGLKEAERKKLFQNLKSLPVVREHYRKPLNYHIGIGCMTCRLSSNELTLAKQFIRSHISKYIESIDEIRFSSGEVDYYSINRPHESKQALVIYPRNSIYFLNFNRVIVSAIETLNSSNSFVCEMEQDYLESTFTPHITIINSNVINKYCNNLSPPRIDCRDEIKTRAAILIDNMDFIIGWNL